MSGSVSWGSHVSRLKFETKNRTDEALEIDVSRSAAFLYKLVYSLQRSWICEADKACMSAEINLNGGKIYPNSAGVNAHFEYIFT